MLHRHVRLLSVWCVHATSACSTPIRLMCARYRRCNVYTSRTDVSRTLRCIVYTSIQVEVKHDDVTCTHQCRWEPNMTMSPLHINRNGSRTRYWIVYTSTQVAVEHDDVRVHINTGTRYIVMFDFHLYWCVNNTSSCSTHIRSWCVHITSSYSTPIRINVYSLHRHVRLPPVLMCTRYIVMFDSHPYWCLHATSSCSTPIRMMCTRYIVTMSRVHIKTDGSRTWRFNVYTSIQMGVEHDDVTCTHQDRWESNMTM
jgi:hypothetical protein